MNSIKEITQLCLREDISIDESLKLIRDSVNNIEDKKEKVKSKVAYRTVNSLKNTKNKKSSWKDFCSNLRQFILFFNEKVDVSENILENIREYLDEFKMINSDRTLNAIDSYPRWFNYSKDLEYMYKLQERKENIQSIGDSLLYNLTGYTQYNSLSQKIAVSKALQLNGGETLLVSLPTGGGKSLVGQIPSLINVKKSKTSIVIVPTIALAIDQEKSSRKLFEGCEVFPRAYHSGMSLDEKVEVINQLKEGTLPILYVSPEAILNNNLYNVVLEAAEDNTIEYFIIDEAHIVLDWGESFRPEFQFLSLLRKKLLEKSNNNIKTILLSATLSDEATTTLKNLFSEEENFIQVRGDSLRSELMIWIDTSKNKMEREEKIIEVIKLLPRPMIIYVNKKYDAARWSEKLLENEYKSIKVFTGDTPTEEREDIIKEWDNENIDIIIATSAFGMGVDKDNVRVVIHACIPESINRYYQEIGRAGRDSYPSICLLSSVKNEDLSDVHELTKGNVATTQNIMNRWNGIINNIHHFQNGNEMWINLYDSKPEHLKYDKTGDMNADWNKYVLLFMLRLNFIELLDMDIDLVNNKFNILIRITDLNLYNNHELLHENVDALREEERDIVNYEIESMKNLATKPEEECFNYKILDVYREAEYVCGGCPNCRKEKREPGISTNNIRILKEKYIYISEEEAYTKLSGSIRRYLGYNRDLYIRYEKNINYTYIISELINCGVKNIIIPDSLKLNYIEIIPSLDIEEDKIYNIYTYKEIYENRLDEDLDYTTTLIYNDNEEEMYRLSQSILQNNASNKVIHLAKSNIEIKSQNKKLEDLIEGNTISINVI